MSEAALQTALETTLKSLTTWKEVTVVINDWHIMDGSLERAPYALIETADSVTAVQNQMIPVILWQIPVSLFVRFTDWQETYNQLRDIRQAMLDENALNENFTSGCYLVNIVRTDTPVGEWYDPHSDGVIPVFVTQRFILEIEESPGSGC